MKKRTEESAPCAPRPEKVVQFGEGNFLRAFVDWILQHTNQKTDFNGGVVVVQPLEKGLIDLLNAQKGVYHVNLQGLCHGESVDTLERIDVISRGLNPYTHFDQYLELARSPTVRFVVSNTTEAGIAFDPTCQFNHTPASSYPGKLTQWLHHRFKTFKGAPDKGVIILPCELIFHNGNRLKKCIEQYIDLWHLEAEFNQWFHTACAVYNTLVDRIVPGYPTENISAICQRLGYNDQLVVKGELFHLWVIEAPQSLSNEFPVDQAGVNVLIVPNEKPYHERKVTLLNGPHTAMSPIGFLCGLDTVGDMMANNALLALLKSSMFDELLPTLDLCRDQSEQFANDILNRFSNPFIKHQLATIMLNAFPKYKARILPALKKHIERLNQLPHILILGLAATIAYYKGGTRGQTPIVVNDDPRIMEFLSKLWKEYPNNMEAIAQHVLGATFIWEEDLNLINGLTSALAQALQNTVRNGEFILKEYIEQKYIKGVETPS